MKNQNHMAQFYKGGYHKIENIDTPFDFDKSVEYEKKVNQRNRTINKLKTLNSELSELQIINGLQLYPKAKLDNYYIHYTPYRTGYSDIFFRATTGSRVEKSSIPEDAVTITVEKKRGVVSLPYAYLYERGIIYVNKLRYAIAVNNNAVTSLRETVIAIHLLHNRYYQLEDNEFVEMSGRELRNYRLNHIKIPEFIQNLYGVDYAPALGVSEYVDAIKNNSLFEKMLKLAPKWVIDNFLETSTTAKTLTEFFKIPKEYKSLMEDENKFTILVSMDEVINANKTNKITFAQLEELIVLFDEILEECDMHEIIIYERYRSTLNTKSVHRFRGTLDDKYKVLLAAYDNDRIQRYYPNPIKYYRYLLDAVVNQGFSSIKSFYDTMLDYLRMCQNEGMKPILDSDFIRRTHDTLARNQKIKLDANEEQFFINNYEDMKFAWKPRNGEYCIVQPDHPQMVINEGNNLSHCVASYVKRIAAGTTHIVFLRKQDAKDISLITVQVTDGAVVQAKGTSNRKPKDKEIKFLQAWAKHRELAWRL